MSIKTGSIPESKILLAGIESDVHIPGPRKTPIHMWWTNKALLDNLFLDKDKLAFHKYDEQIYRKWTRITFIANINNHAIISILSNTKNNYYETKLY